MSISRSIPISSATVGADDDGFIIGRQPETTIHGVMTSAQFGTNRFLRYFNKDVASYGIDLISSIGSGVFPLGTQAQMNFGDGYIVACDEDTAKIRIKIKTSGVGTWTGFKFYDSTNGSTFNREITGVTDGTNGLKAAVGWHEIVLPDSFIANRSEFSPFPEADVEIKKWIKIVPQGTGFTVTTAPEIDGIALLHPTSVKLWNDTSSTFLGSSTVAPTAISVHAEVSDQSILIFNSIPTSFILYYFAAGAAGRTRKFEYATTADGMTFADLQNVVDPTNDLVAVPATSPERVVISFTTPNNIAKATRTFTKTDGTTVTFTDKYFIAFTTTAVSSLAPLLTSSSSWRTTMLGAAANKGVSMVASTIRRVAIERRGGSTGAGDVTFQIYNDTKMTASDSMTFPANDSNNVQNFDITDLTFADGDKMQMKHTSGARVLNDLAIDLIQ